MNIGRIFVLLLIFELSNGKRCKIIRSKKSVMANCAGLGLEHVPDDLPYNITFLDLSRNNIDKLFRKSFEKYKHLRTLVLNKNNLTVLEESAFFGISYLQKLSLRYNHLNISSLGDKSMNSPTMQILDLRNNFEDSVTYPYLGTLEHLTDLYIDLAPTPVFSDSGINKLSNLKTLKFGLCQILKMENNTFSRFPNSVESIHFTGCNQVTVIEADFLKPFPRLHTFVLRNSYICLKDALRLVYPFTNKHMQLVSFVGVRDSRQDSNAIKVTKQMMTHLQKICMKTLVLAETLIVDFEPGSLLTYDHPECFEAIILTGNRFSVFTETKMKDVFRLQKRVVNLKVLDFSFIPIMFDNIRYLPGSAGKISSEDIIVTNWNKKYFKNIQLQKKDITYYKEDLMVKDVKKSSTSRTKIIISFPPKLKILRISHLLLTSFSVDNIEFTNISSLEYLDISYYQIQSFPNFNIVGKNGLRYLDVSGIDAKLYLQKTPILFATKLTTAILQNARLGAALFQNGSLFHLMPYIKHLDISLNSLWFLNSDIFSKNKQLECLVLQRNVFREIPLAIISLSKLAYLDLRSNYIQYINATLRNWMEGQDSKLGVKFKLFLDGNIFKCSCDTADFIQWLLNTKITLDKKPDKYVCHLENGTLKTILEVNKHFHELFSNCDSETWLRIGIGFLSVFFIITVTAAIIFNFRWNIAYLIYRKFKRVVEEKIRKTFMYDIYISYTDCEADWVKSNLVPKIEDSWGMKMCIYDRDFLAGDFISDSIANAIKESRNIFFIISDGFSTREWTLFEIQRAKYEKYTNNLQKIVVIIKQATMNEIPTELEQIWKDINVIHWSPDDNEQGWDKLRLVLFSQTF